MMHRVDAYKDGVLVNRLLYVVTAKDAEFHAHRLIEKGADITKVYMQMEDRLLYMVTSDHKVHVALKQEEAETFEDITKQLLDVEDLCRQMYGD